MTPTSIPGTASAWLEDNPAPDRRPIREDARSLFRSAPCSTPDCKRCQNELRGMGHVRLNIEQSPPTTATHIRPKSPKNLHPDTLYVTRLFSRYQLRNCLSLLKHVEMNATDSQNWPTKLTAINERTPCPFGRKTC
jgi:hypothetical protein